MNITHNLDQLDTFIEFIPDLAFFKDTEGKYTFCNEKFLNFISMKRENVIGKTDFELFSKENAEKFHKIDNDVLISDEERNFDESFVHPDGFISYFHTTKQIVKDKEGKQLGLFCIARNITVRKQYEIIYEDSETLLEHIAIENVLENILLKIVHLAESRNPNSKCSILLLDKEKKHLINGVAPSLADFYTKAINGLAIGDKVGSCGTASFRKQRVIVENINTHEYWKPFLELTQKANLHSCWSEPIISSNNEALGTFAIYYDTPKIPSEFELKLISSYAHLASVGIEKNMNFNLIREKEKEIHEQTIKSNNELKEMNTIAQSLTNYQSTLLSLFDKGDAVLFKWKNDDKQNMEYVSKSIERLLGYTKNDFLTFKKTYKSCIHLDDQKNVLEEINKFIEDKEDYFKHRPYRVISRNGEEKWVLDYTVTQKNLKGEITHFIAYITDITEQRHQQELSYQQSKMVSMGEMIENIAHQWRQPLSVISTIATGSKLEKELNVLSDEDFMRNMEFLNTNAQYLSRTIDDFRNFIKGNRDLENFNLSQNIQSFLNVVEPSIHTSNIKVILDLNDDIVMQNYPNDMIQAFINIMSNSKEVLLNLPRNERYFFITTKKANDRITISLKDNGGGIKEELLEKIFEPYTTSKHKSLGTGLGLNITYNFIVQGMSGNIIVQNTTYTYKDKTFKGTEFIITFN